MAADKSPDRIALEARAEDMGVDFPWNIGDEKLAERVAAADAEAADQGKPSATVAVPEPLDISGMVVRVIGPKKGRWRAGRFFAAEPVDIPGDDLRQDDLNALRGDPKLTVEMIGRGE